MADNLPGLDGQSKKPKDNKTIKKFKKAIKKAYKNVCIIIKAVGVLSIREFNKIKHFVLRVFEKIKAAKIGIKVKKALMFLIKVFIVLYCICIEGILWLSRILGPKIRSNKILNSLLLKIKSILPKQVKVKFIGNLVLAVKKVIPKANNKQIIVEQQAITSESQEIKEIKTKVAFSDRFKPFIKNVYVYSNRTSVNFRRRSKVFFKNPKHNFKALIEKIKIFNKQHNNILVPISVVSLCLIIGLYVVTFYTIGLNVYAGKDIVARTSSQQKFESFVNDFEKKISTELQEPYDTKLNYYYEFSVVPKSKLDKFDDFEKYLIINNHEIQQMYVLKVNDKIIGANLDDTKLKQILENYKSRYSSGVQGERLEFVENVVVEKQLCKVDCYKSISEIENILLNSKSKAVADHTVQQGETLSEIASKYGMKTSELLALNPSVSEKKLQIGIALAVSKDKPVISIRTIKPMTYNQAVAYGTQTQSDDSMYKNQTKVKSSGILGEETVKADVVMVDGIEVDRTILERQTIVQPTDQVVLRGTKALPSTAATGYLRTPVSGIISSRFGYRSGGEYHTGLDIAAPTGTPVYAADGGRVVFAGWGGSYGYLIEIDHQNGIQTWYAHLSAINVSVGTNVAKGSQIGAVGATGRATGPHLHIEVRVNGVPVNPQNYLN